MTDSDQSEGDDTQILQAALTTAFSPGHVRKESASTPSPDVLSAGSSGQAPTPAGSDPESADPSSQEFDDSWKTTYETNLQSWRAQSAVAREKAEKIRMQWEAFRAAETEELARLKADWAPGQGSSWEDIGKRSVLGSSGSITDVVNASTPDLKASVATGTDASKIPSTSTRGTTDDAKLSLSQKWETLQASPTSSHPSLSFPDNSNTSSHEIQLKSRKPDNQARPQSVTLTIFDSSLPAGVRLSALVSSLAINMLLPFVNGVMLGFGEIFAKTVVIGWFGWKLPGSVTTNLGIRSTRT